MSKLKLILYWFVALLPLILMLILLPNVPNTVPLHYGINGEVNRWGSKNELLLLPIISLFVSALLLLIVNFSAKKSERGEQNKKVLFSTGIILSMFFCLLSVTILYYTSQKAINLNETNAIRIISISMCGIFVFMGNLLPKCKRDTSRLLQVGFRTPWTLADDTVWVKTNRLGGMGMVAAGTIGFVLAFILPKWWAFWTIFALIILVVICGSVYSWALYNRLHKSEKD